MIKVRVRYQDHVDGRQVADAQSRSAQSLEYEKPAGEIGIDDDTATADLHEEAGVSDEGHTEFSITGEPWRVSFAAAWRNGRVADQASELAGAFTQGRIAKRCFDHPATEPEAVPSVVKYESGK